jgi:hypothetical protein
LRFASVHISAHDLNILHFFSTLPCTTMAWFSIGKKKGITPGPGKQNDTNEKRPSPHVAAYLSSLDTDNVAPVEYPSPNHISTSTQFSAIRELKCEVLASWLLAKAEERMWVEGSPGQGVFVKKHKGSYARCPDVGDDDTGLDEAINRLNVRVRCPNASIGN